MAMPVRCVDMNRFIFLNPDPFERLELRREVEKIRQIRHPGRSNVQYLQIGPQFRQIVPSSRSGGTSGAKEQTAKSPIGEQRPFRFKEKTELTQANRRL